MSAPGRTKVTAPNYVVDYDGKKLAGISASDEEKRMSWMRLRGNLNGLSDRKRGNHSGTVIPGGRLGRLGAGGLRNRAEQASYALKFKALRLECAKDSMQLAEGASGLGHMLHKEKKTDAGRLGALGGVTDGLLSGDSSGTYRGGRCDGGGDRKKAGPFRIGEARPLGEDVESVSISRVRGVHAAPDVKVIYLRMRGASSRSKFVNLSVEANWRDSWRQILDAYEFLKLAMAEFNTRGEKVGLRG